MVLKLSYSTHLNLNVLGLLNCVYQDYSNIPFGYMRNIQYPSVNGPIFSPDLLTTTVAIHTVWIAKRAIFYIEQFVFHFRLKYICLRDEDLL